jgi:hypothetical protein
MELKRKLSFVVAEQKLELGTKVCCPSKIFSIN